MSELKPNEICIKIHKPELLTFTDCLSVADLLLERLEMLLLISR